MLSAAKVKLQEALEIIDDFGAHLPGIHVATAISALDELIRNEEVVSRNEEPVRAVNSS
jgi:hypothetical protein